MTEELRRQWQLPVYFQLRWKEIVGRLEQKLALVSSGSNVSAPKGQGQDGWTLPQSPAIWEAVQACWDDKVYLPELGTRFLRLTLQVSHAYTSAYSARY